MLCFYRPYHKPIVFLFATKQCCRTEVMKIKISSTYSYPYSLACTYSYDQFLQVNCGLLVLALVLRFHCRICFMHVFSMVVESLVASISMIA